MNIFQLKEHFEKQVKHDQSTVARNYIAIMEGIISKNQKVLNTSDIEKLDILLSCACSYGINIVNNICLDECNEIFLNDIKKLKYDIDHLKYTIQVIKSNCNFDYRIDKKDYEEIYIDLISSINSLATLHLEECYELSKNLEDFNVEANENDLNINSQLSYHLNIASTLKNIIMI